MSRRTDKVNELLRREIGTTIQRDFEFPGTIVTVIEVEVTDDLKEGKVWVGVVGKMAPSQEDIDKNLPKAPPADAENDGE